MKKQLKRSLEVIVGILLVLLGIAGLFLPFLQGILFLIAGITLISPAHGKKFLASCKTIGKRILSLFSSPKK